MFRPAGKATLHGILKLDKVDILKAFMDIFGRVEELE